jgi:lysophospholipase L1-like esterase
MLRFLSRFSSACTVMLAVSLPAKAADHPGACPAAHVAPLVLPRVKEALDHNSELTIVAFGSSSTQGWHSSNIAQSYPAVLQAALSAALPTAHVAVINRGVGGQDAAEMVPRIEADVLDVRPSLVIWQVGANGALKNRDPEEFRRLVANGVRTLRDNGIDVVLMDNQRAPLILASPFHQQIDQVLVDVATQTGTGLFDRGVLMDQWQFSGHPYGEFISDDGVHHNDFGYRCVAQALASAILAGLNPVIPPLRSASARH